MIVKLTEGVAKGTDSYEKFGYTWGLLFDKVIYVNLNYIQTMCCDTRPVWFNDSPPEVREVEVTRISFNNRSDLFIKETPEQIMDMIGENYE